MWIFIFTHAAMVLMTTAKLLAVYQVGKHGDSTLADKECNPFFEDVGCFNHVDVYLTRTGFEQTYQRGLYIDEWYNQQLHFNNKRNPDLDEIIGEVKVRAANTPATILSAYAQLFGMYQDEECKKLVSKHHHQPSM